MRVAKSLLAAGGAAAILIPAAAHAWTKSYVVEWFEPAFKFGAPAGSGPDVAGTDCPTGANDIDIKKELNQPFRTPDRVAYLSNPEHGLEPIINNFGFRGPHAENIYENPTALPDPGFKEVASAIAEGFDLDGDATNGFTGVDGAKGVDNAYYKAAGCVRRWRGEARNSSTAKYQMEIMRSGAFTVVMVVSGKGADPMNDADVQVGFYTSPDQVVKDAGGAISPDYTFRVDPEKDFQSVIKAHTSNGVLEESERGIIKTHETIQTEIDRPWLTLYQSRLRFDLKPSGPITGMIGGYRDWYDLYRDPVGNGGDFSKNKGLGTISGAIAERLGRFNAVGFYYALRRNADGLKDPVTGQNHGISAAYRYYLQPAFVVKPDAKSAVEVAEILDR